MNPVRKTSSVLEKSPSDPRKVPVGICPLKQGPNVEWCFIVPIKRAVNEINLGGKGSTERKMKFYSPNIE